MDTVRLDPLARWAARALGVVLFAAACASLLYAVATLVVRPPDGVEGEVLFEAARLRACRPLYLDPLVGALEYGPPPSRYYVLYPPAWSWAVSLLPGAAAAPLARGLAMAGWFGLLGAIVGVAPKATRRIALLAAAFVAGTYTLTLYGASARPDAPAVCAAGFALLLAVRRGGVNFWAGALFALAAWLKPNVLGLGAGAFVATLVHDRRSAVQALLGALAVSAPIAFALQRASGGAWVTHLLLSTGQPPSLSLWLDQMRSRLPFFGGFLAFAAWCGMRHRASPGVRLALFALASSTGWALLSLSKIGSASNYWMEPCVAALVVLAHAPPPARMTATPLVLAVVQALWSGVATVRSSFEGIADARAHANVLARARSVCGVDGSAIVLADEPGLELALDGRLVSTPFQLTHLSRRGVFPVDVWRKDVESPEVQCLVVQDDLLERPLAKVDPEHDRFPPGIREALLRRFVRASEDAGWRTYRLRR